MSVTWAWSRELLGGSVCPPRTCWCAHTHAHVHTHSRLPPLHRPVVCILWVACSRAQGSGLRDPWGAAGGPLAAGRSPCRHGSGVGAALRPEACARRDAGGAQAVELGQVRRAAVPRGGGRVTGAPSGGGRCKDLVSLPEPWDTATLQPHPPPRPSLQTVRPALHAVGGSGSQPQGRGMARRRSGSGRRAGLPW